MKNNRIFCLLLCVTTLVTMSIFPMTTVAVFADYSDMPNEGYWSQEALTSAVENGLLQGIDNKLNPNDNLTRSQMAAVINRAFGATTSTDISGYTDVAADAWYYNDMAKAVQMKTFEGDGTATLRPQDNITRQEAFVVLARALKLSNGDLTVLDKFSDKNQISSWAADSLASLAGAGYISGSGGMISPLDNITREAFAQIMHNAISNYITKAGIYTSLDSGNVMINTSGVSLKDLTIKGDLIIGEGVGTGDVTLDNVSLTGRVVVRSGGENSIHIINNSKVGSIVVGKTDAGAVRIVAEDGCEVEMVFIDDGNDDVIIEGSFTEVSVRSDVPIILKNADVGTLTVSASTGDVTVESGKVASVEVNAGAADTSFTVQKGATIDKFNTDAKNTTVEAKSGATITEVTTSGSETMVKGEGSVGKVTAASGAANTTIETKGTEVNAENGSSGTMAGDKAVNAGSTTKTEGTTTSSGGGGGGGSSNNYYTATVTTIDGLITALSDSNANVININGDITINSEITFASGKTITNNNNLIINVDGKISVAGSFINSSSGSIEIKGAESATTGAGVLLVQGNGSLTNNNDMLFKCSSYLDSNDNLHEGGTLMIESGTFTNTSNSAVTFEAVIANRDGGYCEIENGTFNNEGTIQAQGLDFVIGNEDTVNGNAILENKAGAVFNAASVLSVINGAVNNRGEINNSGWTYVAPGCEINNYNAGTLWDSGTIDALAIGSDPIEDNLVSGYYGEFVFDKYNTINQIKSLEIRAGDTFVIESGKTLNMLGGTEDVCLIVTTGAIMTISTGASLIINTDCEINNSNQINVYGTVTNNNSIYVAPGAELNIFNSGTISGTGAIDAFASAASPTVAAQTLGYVSGYYGEFAFDKFNEVTLLKSGIHIQSDDTLIIPINQKLILPSGVTLIIDDGTPKGILEINGLVEVQSGATLTNNGTIQGSGSTTGAGTYPTYPVI